jgi:deazaflavin-dependent oxidoreductase (nitroreductase family)
MLDMDLLFLTTIGKRSGEPRVSAVTRFPDGEDAWLIAATAGGRATNPAWYHNIKANPDRVWIELPGRRLQVTPEILEGERRGRAWELITRTHPRFAGYEKKTNRLIPVIRLTPTTGH